MKRTTADIVIGAIATAIGIGYLVYGLIINL